MPYLGDRLASLPIFDINPQISPVPIIFSPPEMDTQAPPRMFELFDKLRNHLTSIKAPPPAPAPEPPATDYAEDGAEYGESTKQLLSAPLLLKLVDRRILRLALSPHKIARLPAMHDQP